MARGEPHPSLPATLVIGLGNPLRGDDGIGIRAVEALVEQSLPDDVEVVDGGTGGLGIVNLMAGRRRLIMVDAADMDRDPGQFVRFTLDEARFLGDDQHLSIHASGVRDALLLAQALQILPEQVIIFGVQPAKIDWDNTLSPQVEAVLPGLVQAILTEVAVSNLQTSHGHQRLEADR